MPVKMQRLKPKIKIFLWVILILTILAFGLGILKPLSSANPTIWVVPSLERISQNANPGSSITKIQLYAARGEYESFQIGIKASPERLTNVNVSVSALKGINTQLIDKANITLYREHYVHVAHSSPTRGWNANPSLGPGWYADGLIPFVDPESNTELTGAELDAVPFNLETNASQAIWVDVFVPKNSEAGEYRGTFTVTSDQRSFTGEIVLKVWNFEIPLKPSLKSSFLVWEEKSKSAFIELLKHKIMPAGDIRPEDERELIDKWGLTAVRLPFWSGANYETCKMASPPSVEDIRATAKKHQPDLFIYVYPVDEIDDCKNLIQPLEKWSQNIKQAGVANLVVMTPVPRLYNNNFFAGLPAVDIWVVSAKMYDESRERVSEALQKGSKVWFYTALVAEGYSPKWLIDFEPINFRIPHGFINQSLGLTGALYSRVDLWTKDPWNDVQTIIRGNDHYPGDGMLVYPGQQVGIKGVVPSMRLKWLRDGVEDYEYVEILKNLGHKELALKVSRSIGSSWSNWTKDPKALEAARQKIGNEIERLTSK